MDTRLRQRFCRLHVTKHSSMKRDSESRGKQKTAHDVMEGYIRKDT